MTIEARKPTNGFCLFALYKRVKKNVLPFFGVKGGGGGKLSSFKVSLYEDQSILPVEFSQDKTVYSQTIIPKKSCLAFFIYSNLQR